MLIFRPNFVAMCSPNWKDIDCGDRDDPKFITNYECEGDTDFILAMSKDTKKSVEEISTAYKLLHPHTSFFSGHASVAWSTASFIFFYLRAKCSRGQDKKSVIANLHHVIQLLCIGLALYVSYTRITDYWHHPTDVLTGGLVGILCQYFNVHYLMQLH